MSLGGKRGGGERAKGGVQRLFELVWVVFVEERIPQPQIE